MNGWVKLHRKLLDNQYLMGNHNLLVMFLAILLSVDHKTGEFSIGRFQLAKLCKMKNSNTYKTLKRLEKLEMVTLKVTLGQQGFTTIRVNKWHIYQSEVTQESNNKVTLKQQYSNNKVTHYKNKELIIKNKEVLTFKEQNKIAEDREKQKGYWKGELSSAKELKRSCNYTGRDPKKYDQLIDKAQVKLAELG